MPTNATFQPLVWRPARSGWAVHDCTTLMASQPKKRKVRPVAPSVNDPFAQASVSGRWRPEVAEAKWSIMSRSPSLTRSTTASDEEEHVEPRSTRSSRRFQDRDGSLVVSSGVVVAPSRGADSGTLG